MISHAAHFVIEALVLLIFVDALLSFWPGFRNRYRSAHMLLESVTEPILQPFRRLVPPRNTWGIDVSPVLAIVCLRLLDMVIQILL